MNRPRQRGIEGHVLVQKIAPEIVNAQAESRTLRQAAELKTESVAGCEDPAQGKLDVSLNCAFSLGSGRGLKSAFLPHSLAFDFVRPGTRLRLVLCQCAQTANR